MFVEWMSELTKDYRKKIILWYLDNRFGCWSNDGSKGILGTHLVFIWSPEVLGI